MPRPAPENPGIGKTSDSDIRRAIYDVMEGGLSQKAAAFKYDIARNNINWTSNDLEGAPRLTPHYRINKTPQ